ncbi:hypothetical protein DLM76_03380 [Leptospira yasudae]|nr:hypothetical protein DLM76_03380 [Leptospira yasudae]
MLNEEVNEYSNYLNQFRFLRNPNRPVRYTNQRKQRTFFTRISKSIVIHSMKRLLFSILILSNFVVFGIEPENFSAIQKRFLEEVNKNNLPFEFEFGSGEESCKNDFNKDGIEDLAMTMRVKPGDSLDSPAMDQNGFLAIALGDANGGYRFDSMIPMIPCNSCGGVYGRPDVTLECGNGKIKISSYGGSNWRWSNSETIRWKSSGWEWIGTDTHSYHTSFGDGLRSSFNRINLDSTRSYEGRMESEQESVPPKAEVRFKKIVSALTKQKLSMDESWDSLSVLPFEIQDKSWMTAKNKDWKGPQDLSFRVRSAWNSDTLGLQISVRDDKIQFCKSKSDDCDAIEIVLDPDSSLLDFDTNSGVRKRLGSQAAIVSLSLSEEKKVRTRLNRKENPKSGIETKLISTNDGYSILCRIPWTVFGKENVSRFRNGFKFLASVTVQDWDDESKPIQRLSTSPIKGSDPYTLGELELIPEKYSLGPWKQEN